MTTTQDMVWAGRIEKLCKEERDLCDKIGRLLHDPYLDDPKLRAADLMAIRGQLLASESASCEFFQAVEYLMAYENVVLSVANSLVPIERGLWHDFNQRAIGQDTPLCTTTQCSLPEPANQHHAHAPSDDQAFVEKVKKELEGGPKSQGPQFRKTWQDEQSLEVLKLLVHGCPPNIHPAHGLVEAHHCSSPQAKRFIESDPTDVIIATSDNRHLNKEPWSIKKCIQLLISEAKRGGNERVLVRIPTLPISPGKISEYKTLQDIYRKFTNPDYLPDQLWNVLDMSNPLPTGIPDFLSGSKCQLLRSIFDSAKGDMSDPDKTLDFVLMGEGGCHTSTHVDSHGFGTFITIHEGRYGFGWITPRRSSPDKIHKKWVDDINSTTQLARFVVLYPGQTIYFPPGTIHFVFRASGEHTLATGGHIVTWHGIINWLETMKRQEKSNFHLYSTVKPESTRALAKGLETILADRIENNDVEDIGGMPKAKAIHVILKNWEDWNPDGADDEHQ